jgi:hypothetical protein
MVPMSYSPFVSTLTYVHVAAATMTPGTDIDIAATIPPGVVLSNIMTGSVNPNSSQFFFQPEDRPVLSEIALFANFADGLLPLDNGAAGVGGVRMSFQVTNILAFTLGDIQRVLVPALNAWFPVGIKLKPNVQAGPPRFFPLCIAEGLLDTTAVDASFTNMAVIFRIAMRFEHTYPLIGI